MIAIILIFLDEKLVSKKYLEHIPRNGDTIRLNTETYVIVTEVIWCFDEAIRGSQRVNLRVEKVKEH